MTPCSVVAGERYDEGVTCTRSAMSATVQYCVTSAPLRVARHPRRRGWACAPAQTADGGGTQQAVNLRGNCLVSGRASRFPTRESPDGRSKVQHRGSAIVRTRRPAENSSSLYSAERSISSCWVSAAPAVRLALLRTATPGRRCSWVVHLNSSLVVGVGYPTRAAFKRTTSYRGDE